MQRERKPGAMTNVKEEDDRPPSLQPQNFRKPIPNRYLPPQVLPNRNAQNGQFGSSRLPRNVVDSHNEHAAMRFLIGNGLPFEAINDQHMREFLSLLNPRRAPPEASNMTSKAHNCLRAPLRYQRQNGPVSVTIEAVRKCDEVFLTISVHYFDETGERQNTVHFEKIILADYEGRVVADRIRRCVDPKKSSVPVVMNIISPNIRMVQLVSQSTKMRNTFICFFSYISNIAREVCHIDEFSMPLQSLREYVDAIRSHREVYTKFKRIQKESPSELPLPVLDVPAEWLSTLQFLSACGSLNETFERVGETWCMPEYLSHSDENAMSDLLEFLSVLCRISTEVCGKDTCVSQVLHSMSLIKNAIETVGIRAAREKMRTIFNKYFESISNPKEKKVGEYYSISSLLDPRYGYSEAIFTEAEWQDLEKTLVANTTLCSSPEINRKTLFALKNELKKFKRLLLSSRPTFENGESVFDWWNRIPEEFPLLKVSWMAYAGIPAVSVDGKRFFAKGGKLAHLFATMDEALTHRALVIAQSSQDFVGRGFRSHQIYERVINVGSTFKKCDYEVDLEEGEEEIEEVIYPDGVKMEPFDDSGEPTEKKPKFSLMDPKLEPEQLVEREIKMEPLD